jgi:hypothetical protein
MNMEPLSIEQLQAAYNKANEELKASPLFLLKEEAGAALQAAHAAIKAERQAAKIAAHAAKVTNFIAAQVADELPLRVTGSGGSATAQFHQQAQNIGNPDDLSVAVQPSEV